MRVEKSAAGGEREKILRGSFVRRLARERLEAHSAKRLLAQPRRFAGPAPLLAERTNCCNFNTDTSYNF